MILPYIRLNGIEMWIYIMEVLSIVAAICSTSASLPQLFTHQELNIFSIVLRGTGGVAWSTYGILRAEWALFASSAIVVVIESTLYLKHRRAPRQRTVLNPTQTNDNEQYPTDAQGDGSFAQKT